MFRVDKEVITSVTEPAVPTTKIQSTYLHIVSRDYSLYELNNKWEQVYTCFYVL